MNYKGLKKIIKTQSQTDNKAFFFALDRELEKACQARIAPQNAAMDCPTLLPKEHSICLSMTGDLDGSLFKANHLIVSLNASAKRGPH